jgi:protein-tyrosine kinase
MRGVAHSTVTEPEARAAPHAISYPADEACGRPLLAAASNAQAAIDLRTRQPRSNESTTSSVAWARKLLDAPDGSPEFRSAYNLVRTQLLQRLEQNGWTTVAVTSPSRRAGNTVTAINLAASIARDFDRNVVLVELDLAQPSFQKLLGFGQQSGVVDYLTGEVPLEQVLLDPGIDRLALVPAGVPAPDSCGLLASVKMARLIDELKGRYERPIILFDLPPALDVVAFARFADCALLVVKEGETRLSEVRAAVEYLKSTNIAGVVLNRAPRRPRR